MDYQLEYVLNQGDTFCSIYINELGQKRMFHFIAIDSIINQSSYEDFDLGQINYKTKILLIERCYNSEYNRFAFYLNVRRNYTKYD